MHKFYKFPSYINNDYILYKTLTHNSIQCRGIFLICGVGICLGMRATGQVIVHRKCSQHYV